MTNPMEVHVKRLVLSLVSLAALGVMGCSADAPSPESTGQASQPILGGTTDSGDPSVVAVIQTDSSGNQYICTGSIIAPTKVLTAGHCVKGMVSWEVRVGTDARNPEQTLAVSGGVADPGGGDIAIITLSQPTDLTPLAYNTTALSDADVGTSARSVGYGSNQINSGQGTGGGTKRTGDTSIKALQDDTFSVHQILCHGDSGGPTFANGKIVGITSYGDTANCVGDDYAVRTDLYADFISSN